MQHPLLTDDSSVADRSTDRLWQLFLETRAPEHRAALVNLYSGLVSHMAQMAAGRSGLDFDDLVQEGTVGLIMAIDRFNPDAGVRVSDFVRERIRQELRKFVKESGEYGDPLPLDEGVCMVGFNEERLIDSMAFRDSFLCLGDETVRIINLRAIHQMSFREISEATGLSEGKVRRRYYHGIIQIKARLGHDLNLVGENIIVSHN